jgi:hypothetical protein
MEDDKLQYYILFIKESAHRLVLFILLLLEGAAVTFLSGWPVTGVTKDKVFMY